MKIPGAVWTALLVALPLVAVWLNEFFPGAIWAAPAAGLLLIVAKVIEVVQAQGKLPAAPPGVEASFAPASQRRMDSVARILWG